VGGNGLSIPVAHARGYKAPRMLTIVRETPAARIFVLALTLALVMGALATPASASTRLVGTVDPRSSVALTLEDARKASTLKPGVYQLTVRDRARRGNFHLVGLSPVRFDRKTGIHFIGSVTWKLNLRVGDYRYFSDTHPARSRVLRVR
jgi:hypothetical protein